MPATAPYPTVNDALTAARVIANDMANSVAGNILANNQPFSLPMADLAHRTLRKMLTKKGIKTFNSYGFCTGLTPVATPDPTVQVQLTYNGYFDGQAWHGPSVQAAAWSSTATYTQGMTVTYAGQYYVALSNPAPNLNQLPNVSPAFWAQFNSIGPALPSNLIEPLEIWVRQSNSYNRWAEVTQAADSISTRSQTQYPVIWDWESDILYLNGFTGTNDLKIKYIQAAPRLTAFTQQIAMADCDMAMGALICELLSGGRGGQEAAVFHSRAEQEVDLLASPDSTKDQYASHNRMPFRATRASRRR